MRWGLLAGCLLLSFAGRAEARRIPLLITSGQLDTEFGSPRPEYAADLLEMTGKRKLKVGYVYDHFGVFFIPIWTWGGKFAVYTSDTYWELTQAEAAELVGESVSVPSYYRYPPGLVLVLGLFLIYVVGEVLDHRKRAAQVAAGEARAPPEGYRRIRAPGKSSSSRAVVIAAAVIILLGLGYAVLSSPGGDDPQPAPPVDSAPADAEPADAEPGAEPTEDTPPTDFLTQVELAESVKRREQLIQEWRGLDRDRSPPLPKLLAALSTGPNTRLMDSELIEELRERPLSFAEHVECLAVSSARVRRALLERLANSPPSDRQDFIELLSDSPAQDAPGILQGFILLGEVTPERVVALIDDLGTDWTAEPGLQEQLVLAANAEPELLDELLADSNPRVRVYGCRLAGEASIEGDVQLRMILPHLKAPTNDVRMAAADALATLANPRASWGLGRQLSREADPYTRERILLALRASPLEPTLDLIARLLKRDSRVDQRAATLSLQAFAPESVVEHLETALGSPHASTVEAALGTTLALCAHDAEPLRRCVAQIQALPVEPETLLAELKARALEALE